MNLADIECKFLRDENFMDIVNQIAQGSLDNFTFSLTLIGKKSKVALLRKLLRELKNES